MNVVDGDARRAQMRAVCEAYNIPSPGFIVTLTLDEILLTRDALLEYARTMPAERIDASLVRDEGRAIELADRLVGFMND